MQRTHQFQGLHNCTSSFGGGICRRCYEGSLIGQTAPPLDSTIQIPISLIYQADVLIGDGRTSTFALSQTSDDWYSYKVVQNGLVVDHSLYNLDYDLITFSSVVTLNDVFVVHFYQEDLSPFQGYMAKTYSGGLLGMKPLPTLPLMLRPILYENQFNDTFIGLMLTELNSLHAIPSTYVDYIERIHTKLEKILYILYLYAIYKAINV